ncbi:MAG: SPOR domain-containing protein [Burkholderiaceae bacterium]
MAAVTPADPAAEAKTRARRTLIGSAILALTAVVVVPLIMDSKPRPWSDDVVLQIPSKDSKFETPLQAPVASPAASPAAAASVSPAPTKPPAATAAVPPEPPKPVQAASPTPAAKPEPAPAKAEAKPTAPASTPKPEAKPEPKAAAASAPAAKAGKVILQAGAFTTEDRIKSVEADLRKAGFAPYREEVETKSGTVTRVRFTVAGEDAAAKAVAKLAAAGITPKIIPQ